MAELRARDWKRVLVRSTNWLGDAILCVPALRALRGALPGARITMLGQAWVKDLYAGEGLLDEALDYPKGWDAAALRAKATIMSEIKRREFDAAVLFQNAFEAAVVARWAGARERIGYNRDGRGWLLTRAVEVPREKVHERFYYLELLRRSGLIDTYDPEAPVRLQSIRAERGNRIGVSPGAAFGSAKRWFPERFAEAAAIVAKQRGASVALFGSAEEAPLVGQVERDLAARGVAVENHAGRTKLREFMHLVAGCELMLTNDSGAMHVAYAVGTPSVTVFGSTDHVGTGPVGPVARIVREPVECAPCKLRECPIDHRCMTRISAGRVADEALHLLGGA